MAEAAAIASMNQLALTSTNGDSLVGTAGNDYIDGTTLGTLSNNDVVIDSSTTDSDLLKATVTSAGVNARLQNIEDVKITGKYVTTGFDLTNTTGTKVLTLDTELAGGTATVTAANSINAAKIVAGHNINTLNVTSLSSGTRDTVTVDGGSANVKLTGVATGADKYDVTVAAGKTLTLATMDSAGDAVSVDAAGNFTLVNTTGTGANLGVTINNTAANAITVTEADATLMAKTLTLSGNDIVLDVTGNTAAVSGIEATSSAASSTIKINATAIAATDLKKAVVTTVDVAKDMLANSLTVNEGTVVNLTATHSSTGKINIDNTAGTLSTGTLLLNVSHDQTTVTTDAKVDTLLVQATPDQASDTVDANGNTQQINVGTTALDAATTTVVVQGTADLDLGTVAVGNTGTIAAGTAEVISAGSMTGKLTIGSVNQDAKIYAGSGNDSITTATANVYEIHAGAGNDTINVTTAAAGTKVYGDAGDDKITASGSGDTIDGGAGNDTITTAAGADTITLGAGTDTIVMGSTKDGATVTDFTAGTDTLVLTGTGGAIDLTSLTAPSAGAYNLDGTANFNVTLTGSSATDLSNSIQLGNSTAAYAATTNTVVAGAKDDVISVSTGTVTTGAGADVVMVTGTGATVKDFTTGTDKIIWQTAAADATVNLTSITPLTGTYTIDGTNTLTLNGHTETTLASMIQLGDATTYYNIDLISAKQVTGGSFNDYIDFGTTANVQTVNFIDNGGVDTLKNFTTGTDKLSFDAMTGITATTAAATDAIAGTRVSDAQDGHVYTLSNAAVNGDTIDFSKLNTTINNETFTYTNASFVDDVAAHISAAMGTTTGEHYVVAITGGDVNGVPGDDTLLYKVDGNTAGITSADIQLIGLVDNATVAFGDMA